MSSLLTSAKNIASVKAGDKSKDYVEVLLDTETTGTDEHAEIIQISFMLEGSQRGVYDEYFLPKNKLSYEAMGINKITEEMLVGKQLIDDPSIALEKLHALNSKENVIIIHNAKFDIDMLSRANFINEMRVVDTLQVARHLLQDAERYTLSTLFFQYGLYKKLGSIERKLNEDYSISLKRLGSHNALYDVVELKMLYEFLLNKAGSVLRLIELSSTPAYSNSPIRFGKHKGDTPEEVAEKDIGYVRWMLGNIEDLDWNLKHTLEILVGKAEKNKKAKDEDKK